MADSQGNYLLRAFVAFTRKKAWLEATTFIRKKSWTPVIGEVPTVEREEDNQNDDYAVAVMKNRDIVGHVPRSISRASWFFFWNVEELWRVRFAVKGSMVLGQCLTHWWPGLILRPALIQDPALVRDPALIQDPALIRDLALIWDPALIRDPALIWDLALICDPAWIRDPAFISEQRMLPPWPLNDASFYSREAFIRSNTVLSYNIVMKLYHIKGWYFCSHG